MTTVPPWPHAATSNSPVPLPVLSDFLAEHNLIQPHMEVHEGMSSHLWVSEQVPGYTLQTCARCYRPFIISRAREDKDCGEHPS